MKQSLDRMTHSISGILGNSLLALYLYGSVALNDFQQGWSDIDILCFTRLPLTDKQVESLLFLRQELLLDEPANPYFRSFEGAFLPLKQFLHGSSGRAVYWGTSGQRVTENYTLDVFSMTSLLTQGLLLSGNEVRSCFSLPCLKELQCGVLSHFHTIRRYGAAPDSSLYACGWLLDISRCLYTLQTGRVAAKTAAGEWALQNGLCPVEQSLRKALEVRKHPLLYRDTLAYQKWAASLGPDIQSYADVLEAELQKLELFPPS